MTAPELEVRDLTKRYSPQSAVGPVSFSVAAGEFLSVLGPSGCGKTTTLRCIAGFETPNSGSIIVGGRAIERDPPNHRNIGLVFQSYALFPHLTVADNVAFGLKLRRLPKRDVLEKVAKVLDLVGLSHAGARYPRQLSGGQQQRVAIARSVVLEPRLILFDEPLSNLDFKLRVTMRTELKALQRRLGKTALYVTHDQGEALALSDRIVVMSNGRVEQIGTPREIYERPATPFVAEFIGNSNLIKANIESADSTSCEVRTDGGLILKGHGRSVRPGSSSLAMVRPEHIRIGAPGPGENGFTARIEEMTYLGQDLQVRVQASDGLGLTVITGGDAARHLSIGDTVPLSISAENVFVMAS